MKPTNRFHVISVDFPEERTRRAVFEDDKRQRVEIYRVGNLDGQKEHFYAKPVAPDPTRLPEDWLRGWVSEEEIEAMIRQKHAELKKIEETDSVAPSPSQPPANAEYLLRYLLSQKGRKNLIGNLAEEYVEIVGRNGLRPAQVWYWCQVVLALWPLFTLIIWRLIGARFTQWLGHVLHFFSVI